MTPEMIYLFMGLLLGASAISFIWALLERDDHDKPA